VLSAIGSYVLLFFMGAFPSFFFFIFNFLFGKTNLGDIRAYAIAQFFGNPQEIFGVSPQVLKYAFVYNLNFIFFPFLILLLFIIFFMTSRKKFLAIAKNLRLPQIVYHTGLFFIGLGLGYLNYAQNFSLNIFSIFAVFTLIICVWLSWIASIILNDVYDLRIDNISNKERPLPQKIFNPKEYAHLGIFCFVFCLVSSIKGLGSRYSSSNNTLSLLLQRKLYLPLHTLLPFQALSKHDLIHQCLHQRFHIAHRLVYISCPKTSYPFLPSGCIREAVICFKI